MIVIPVFQVEPAKKQKSFSSTEDVKRCKSCSASSAEIDLRLHLQVRLQVAQINTLISVKLSPPGVPSRMENALQPLKRRSPNTQLVHNLCSEKPCLFSRALRFLRRDSCREKPTHMVNITKQCPR